MAGWFSSRRAIAGPPVPVGPDAPLIELRHVVKTFESAAGSFAALKGIDLQIDRGEFVAVIGKSGSGKSTLINMITGIDHPSAGEVLVDSTAVHKLGENALALWRGRTIGIVFQFFQLLPTLSVAENVMLPMDFAGRYPGRERRARALELLAQFDLADHADKLPAALSGGQQQRVAIARALANDPPLLVADEPTGNLDSQTAEQVFELFAQLVEHGKTILMVTHDQDLARRVSRTVIIADGAVIDEYLARALPALSEALLIKATQQLEALSFPPGAQIVREGQPLENFYVIARGRVEIVLQEPNGHEIVVAVMGPGQYFGEIELLRGGGARATARAGLIGGVDLVALDRNEFAALMAESEALRASVGQIAAERAAENLAARAMEDAHA